jgi:hypothetical protein
LITDAGTAEERAPYTGLETRALSEQTTERTTGDNAALIADLTDLLQLEFDALPAYSVAIAGLRRPDLRDKLASFRADHERHAHDLSAHIRRLGGVPLALPHLPTGLLKLGVQMAGLSGGDRAVLCVFRRKAAGDSDGTQPLNPAQASRRFRREPATPARG